MPGRRMIRVRSQIDPGSETVTCRSDLGEARPSKAYRPSRKPLTHDLGQFFQRHASNGELSGTGLWLACEVPKSEIAHPVAKKVGNGS
jgi:hypothetical protein